MVCGSEEHIHTLNFSLRYLSHFSVNDIMVVTDLKRNAIPIDHVDVRDIETPSDYDHHQASIYLKTSLNKILDLEVNNYCYLDSDVIAASPKVDDIFSHAIHPITFAHDHCTIDVFSPNAMNCDCLEQSKVKVNLLDKLSAEYENKCKPKDSKLYEKYETIIRLLDLFGEQTEWFGKNTIFRLMLSIIYPLKYNFARFLKANGGFVWNRKERKVYDSIGNMIYDDAYLFPDFIENNSEFRHDKANKTWYDTNGKEVYKTSCNHLVDAIESKFGINVNNNQWQHWNGGVFLFNKSSNEFMDLWFEKTMEVFKDKSWKVRDQGTLIATVWQMNLQGQAYLPSEFNFLADYNMMNLSFEAEKGFSYNNFETSVQPAFYHIYHHFGDKSWEVWQHIEKLLPAAEPVSINQ